MRFRFRAMLLRRLLFGLCLIAVPAMAQAQEAVDAVEMEVEEIKDERFNVDHVTIDPDSPLPPEIQMLKKRVELAQDIQALFPAEKHLEAAIDEYLTIYPEQYRPTYKAALWRFLPPLTLQQIAIDAYAGVYTTRELQAMYDFYTSPEGRSILQKEGQYDDIVSRRISKIFDQAMLSLKAQHEAASTGAQGNTAQE